MDDYKKWLTSGDAKAFAIDNIKKSGIPLELRSRKILKDNEFTVSEAHYLEPQNGNSDIDLFMGRGVWRQLDLLATRVEKQTISLSGCELRFTTEILGECKYSSDKDIITFEHSNPENVDLSNFPVMVNGQSIIFVPSKTGIKLPPLVERLIMIDASSASREKDNFRDIEVHRACEQILSALRYNLYQWRSVLRRQYLDISKGSRIEEKWQDLIKEQKVPYEQVVGGMRVPASFIEKFLSDNFDPVKMLQDFPLLVIRVCFPVIVTDGSRGIIQAKLNDSFEVIDLEDKGLCLYTYVSENADRYESVLGNAFALPIIVCNLSNLPAAIKLIGENVNCVIDQTRLLVNANPQLIPREVLFNLKVVGL